MVKYLYGANVKAVQQFIFQTNKLKEIIGASELVEQICTTLFSKQTGKKELDKDSCCIIAAAGVIKYIFDDETECRKLVRGFPKVVLNAAPGIVFNQAVVKMKEDKPTEEELKQLEQRLKTQRNKAVPPLETGLRITERSRRTGLPAIEFENKEGVVNVTNDPKKKEAVDKATSLKKKAGRDGKGSFGDKLSDKNRKDLNFLFPFDIKEIAIKLLEDLKKDKLQVEQWADKSVTAAAVFNAVSKTLFETLPYPTYQTDDVDLKTNLVYEHLKQQYFGGGLSIYGPY